MISVILNAAFLIVIGALGAAGFIVSKKPDAKEMLAKLSPYQGIIGTVGALWGIQAVIGGIGLLSVSVLWAVVTLVGGLALFATGFLLGFPWFMSFNKSAEAAAKAEQLRGKLVTYQVPAGFVCIVLGLLSLGRMF